MKNKRQLENDPEKVSVALVTAWLNGKPSSRFHGKPSKASIKRIIDLRDNLIQLLSEVNQLAWSTRCDQPLPHIDRLNDELNDRLSLYSITQVFQRYDGKDWGIDGVVGGERRITIGESLAAHNLCELASMYRLDRVRECLCGNWFHASRVNQQSCSSACRKNKHQQTDAFREKRRLYMRGYYKLKQSGKVR